MAVSPAEDVGHDLQTKGEDTSYISVFFSSLFLGVAFWLVSKGNQRKRGDP